ncbi:MAG: hypothetical protein KBS44_02025 [Clostridiales bacterium]|nr:hypothetical protein [Candidatus Coliplasma equi]
MKKLIKIFCIIAIALAGTYACLSPIIAFLNARHYAIAGFKVTLYSVFYALQYIIPAALIIVGAILVMKFSEKKSFIPEIIFIALLSGAFGLFGLIITRLIMDTSMELGNYAVAHISAVGNGFSVLSMLTALARTLVIVASAFSICIKKFNIE